MKILVIILSIIIFIKTVSYGIYELKEKNKSGRNNCTCSCYLGSNISYCDGFNKRNLIRLIAKYYKMAFNKAIFSL